MVELTASDKPAPRSSEAREHELDLSAAFGSVSHSNAPPVGLRDRAHDREPQSRPAGSAIAGRIGAMEAVEDALTLRGRGA